MEQNYRGGGQVFASSIPLSPEPERLWTQKVRNGDREAFAALFNALYPSLWSIASRRIGAPDVAEELVQDVFVTVWERREHLDPEQSLTRYLCRAVRNQALDYLKHQEIVQRSRGSLAASLRRSPPTPEEDTRYREVSDAAQDAIERLPDRCREIFLLSRQGEMRQADIARLLGISVKTVETQMGRALKALRTALKPYVG